MSIAKPAKPANTTMATAVPIKTWPDCLLNFIAASTARTFDYFLLIVVELYPAWGTSPGTKTAKFVPLLYSGFAPFGNGSVVLILLKTKALDVLGRFARHST
jgi:hypothetical protein